MVKQYKVMKKISIVIPCRNEAKYIANCIYSLLDNIPKDCDVEILVIDGMSTDGTRKIVEDIITNNVHVKMIDNHDIVTPNALNLGVNNATGEYTMIASAHSSFEPKYIEKLMNAMDRLNADVVGGFMQTAIKNITPKALAIKEVISCKFGVGNAMFRVGVEKEELVDTVPFGLYKTDLFKEIGGYDNRLIRNHDIELSKRLIAAGKKIYLIPDALCTYYARETFGAIAQNNYRNGLWNILTVKITKNFSSLSLRHFIPLIFLLSLILPSAFAALWWPLCLISALSLTCYLLALCLISLKLAVTKKLNFFYLSWTFIVLHFSYATGSLVGIFKHVKK